MRPFTGELGRMPRVNPEDSFEVAARHLFRHIIDVKALRANPLLRSYFGIPVEGGGSVLPTIHAEILSIADTVCDELQKEGLRKQAHRRREIVVLLCAGETAGDSAKALQLSRSHYYRERHAICSRVARALANRTATHDARFVVRDDALRLLFRRAESLRDGGCSNQAVRLLEHAYHNLAEELPKSAVALALAEELVFLGRHARAKELLARSRQSEAGAMSAGSEWLGDASTLNKARLRSQLSGDADAGHALEALAKRRVAEGRSDDATFDAVFLCGEWYRNSGRYKGARTMLRHLRAMKQSYSHALAKRQIAILLLAAYCAEDSSDEVGLSEQSFRDAFDLSISSGTVVGALLATSGLIHYAAARGRDDAAYAMAHETLRMAEGVDFDGFLGYVTAEVIGALLQTSYWRATAPLLFDAEKLTAPGTLRYAWLKRAQSIFLTRTGRRHDAREAMFEAYAVARKLGDRRLEGLTLRDQASLLQGPKAVGSRSELMREAIELIERYGSAGDLSTTYAAAAEVLNDRRTLRLSRQATPFASRRPAREDPGRSRRIEPLMLPSRSML